MPLGIQTLRTFSLNFSTLMSEKTWNEKALPGYYRKAFYRFYLQLHTRSLPDTAGLQQRLRRLEERGLTAFKLHYYAASIRDLPNCLVGGLQRKRQWIHAILFSLLCMWSVSSSCLPGICLRPHRLFTTGKLSFQNLTVFRSRKWFTITSGLHHFLP